MRKAVHLCVLCATVTGILISVGPANADYLAPKFIQLPDLTPNGMDVNATYKGPNQFPYFKVLADDFLCTSPTPVADIHIWGSWLEDMVNPDVTFKLSIHADVPAPPTGGYSHPGQQLWSMVFAPNQYKALPYTTAREWFFEPNQNRIIGQDTQVWQYNFFIPPDLAFLQQGTPSKPMVYWLDVVAILPENSPEVFGWKTSFQHWNDDAVFSDIMTPDSVPPDWRELRYPQDIRLPQTLWGKSIDLAFVITPEPGALSLLALGSLLALRRRP